MKYLNIVTLGSNSCQLWVCRDGTNTVVMVNRDTNKVDFDRRAVGLRVKKGYRPPTDTSRATGSGQWLPGVFTNAEAIQMAHQIGRYMFGLGDLVYAYTYVDGFRNDDFFTEGVNKALGHSE